MTQIRSVLFDMDGVLYAYDFENRLNLLESALDVPKEKIRAEIFDSGFENSADDSNMTSDAYIAGISARLGLDVRPGQWIAARKWAMAPEPMVIDLARQLKQRVDIALLTNNNALTAEHLSELAPELPDLFGENLFVSASIGVGKDHAETFTRLCAQLGWSPETTLFVDDNAAYIASAEKAGLVTHHFTDAGMFRSALSDYELP